MSTAVALSPGLPEIAPYPATLPIEIALGDKKVREVCEAYGLTKADWEELRYNKMFIADVERAKAELVKEGVSFKIKARMQSEAMLKTSWDLVHDKTGDVPPSVKADLIKFTARVAGLDTKETNPQSLQNALQIVFQF